MWVSCPGGSSNISLTLLDPPAIEHAMAAGLKEVGAEFTKLVSMGEEKGTRYYKANHERIGGRRRNTFTPNACWHFP